MSVSQVVYVLCMSRLRHISMQLLMSIYWLELKNSDSILMGLFSKNIKN